MNYCCRGKKEPVTGHRKVNAGRGHDEGGQASQDGNDDKSGEDLRARSTKENLADLRGKRLTISHFLHRYQVDEGSARQYVDQSDDHNSVDKRTRHGARWIANFPGNFNNFSPTCDCYENPHTPHSYTLYHHLHIAIHFIHRYEVGPEER